MLRLRDVIGPRGPTESITLGGHALPRHAETKHVLVCGSTGTGKSTLMDELIDSARARGDRLVLCDPAGFFLSRFARTGDILMTPFDGRALEGVVLGTWKHGKRVFG